MAFTHHSSAANIWFDKPLRLPLTHRRNWQNLLTKSRASRSQGPALQYTIGTLPDRFHISGFNVPIYVTLQLTGTVWEIGDVNEAPPTGDVPYLKGRALGGQISYGIERYYVPEGKGKHVPRDLYAEIVILPGGTAQLKKLYSDGKPWPR
jgi:hypothetical protein